MCRTVPVSVWLCSYNSSGSGTWDITIQLNHTCHFQNCVCKVCHKLSPVKKFSGGSKWNFSELSLESLFPTLSSWGAPAGLSVNLLESFSTLNMEYQQSHVLADSSACPEQSDPLTRAGREHSKSTRKPEIQLLWRSSLCCRAAALPRAVWWVQV